MLLTKTKLNSMEILISEVLRNSYIIYKEFVLLNDALKEHNEIKEEITK